MWHSVSRHFYFLNKTQINLYFCLFYSEFDKYKQLHKCGVESILQKYNYVILNLLFIESILEEFYTVKCLNKSYFSFNCGVPDMMLDGSFRVISGDVYNVSLLDHSSDLFQRKSHIYKLMASILNLCFIQNKHFSIL